MELLLESLSNKIGNSQSLFDNVINVNYDPGFVYDRIYDMVNHSIVVDGMQIKKKEFHS